MEPKPSKSSPDSAGEEDPSGFYSTQSLCSALDAMSGRKSGLEKKPSGRSKQLPWREDEVRELNRKKDVVSLILSYPPFNTLNHERHRGWIRDVLEITHKVRELYKEKEVNVSQLSPEITRLLHHPIHDIEAHVPSGIIVKMCKECSAGFITPKKAMLDLCIDDFMTRQILQDIQIPEFRTIQISMVNDKNFVSRLKNLPPIWKMFDLVIQVNVKSCCGVEAIEGRIIKELGFSKSSRVEAEELLKSQNFLILLDDFQLGIDSHDLGINWWNSYKIQKIVFITENLHSQRIVVDLEIRRENHLLSWELFRTNVGEVVHFQQPALRVWRQCSGHLLATVLMARALKEVKDVRIWQHASRVIGFLPTSHTEDIILFNALAFVRRRLHYADECVKFYVSYQEMQGIDKIDLIERWITKGLIGTLHEGEEIIVQGLINAYLLESFRNGDSVRMRDEIRDELVNLYKTEMHPMILFEQDGKGLREAPKNEAWEEINEMHLMNNKISKLPENPNCPKLIVLFLQVNYHLRAIPLFFFECMPILQILDLSHTRIKSLPASFFRLVQLRNFILRGCELFKELSSEVGNLCHLEVLDLGGTELISLPVAVGKLTKLTCLKVSFCWYNNYNRKNNHSNRIIPQHVILNLPQLEELSIDVNPDDERWKATVKDIIEEVCSLNRLRALKLYLPEAVLLNDLLKNITSPIDLSLMRFMFDVGSHLKRIRPRPPHNPTITFEEGEERYLKYMNDVGVPTEIKEILQLVTVFFLDRHLTLTSLTEFGNMANLKFCELRECNDIETIVDANKNFILHSLEYLNLYRMKNLRSIWMGPHDWSSLSRLKALALYSCPRLTTIFTLNLVRTLKSLEELVVDDCPEINSIVTHEVPAHELSQLTGYLPNLKKISLHFMPNLVSISGGVGIGPRLEWLSFFDCPSLKTLSPKEVSSKHLKVIIGEADWWSELRWNTSEGFQPPNLDAIFFPIEGAIDLETQLAEINDQLQAQMQETGPSQQS